MAVINSPLATTLSNDEVLRYSRHLIMPEVGMAGQQKLKAARVPVYWRGRTRFAPRVVSGRSRRGHAGVGGLRRCGPDQPAAANHSHRG